MLLGNDHLRERVARFGDAEHLVAIVSEPPRPQALPAILILNAGVLHRVGPHRLHVRLARQLASRGHLVTRLDLSGIGDSRALPGRLTFRESSVADIRTAMDALAGAGHAGGFVLFGICSGADNALAAAEGDERIVGLVLVDPPSYASRQARVRKFIGDYSSLGAWGRLPGRVLRSAARRMGKARRQRGGQREQPAHSGGREMPPIARYRQQLNLLAARGLPVLAIHSGVLGARYNQREQLFENFPELRGRIDCAYFPQANHTFTELSAQSDLETLVLGWCDRYSPAS